MARLRKILIIDDDDLYRSFTKGIVEDLGIANSVVDVSSATEGLNYLMKYIEDDSECPDLILLDNKMPEVDGLEFLNLKNISPQLAGLPVKVFMLSSSVMRSEMEKAKKLGALEYIVKPLTEEKLQEAIQRSGLSV